MKTETVVWIAPTGEAARAACGVGAENPVGEIVVPIEESLPFLTPKSLGQNLIDCPDCGGFVDRLYVNFVVSHDGRVSENRACGHCRGRQDIGEKLAEALKFDERSEEYEERALRRVAEQYLPFPGGAEVEVRINCEGCDSRGMAGIYYDPEGSEEWECERCSGQATRTVATVQAGEWRVEKYTLLPEKDYEHGVDTWCLVVETRKVDP